MVQQELFREEKKESHKPRRKKKKKKSESLESILKKAEQETRKAELEDLKIINDLVKALESLNN